MKILKTVANLENYAECELNGDYVKGSVSLREEHGCIFVDFEARCEFSPYEYSRIFEQYNSVVIAVDIGDVCKILAQRLKSPFWAEPVFATAGNQLPDRLQYMLIEHKSDTSFILPISNTEFCTYLRGGKNNNTIEICVCKVSPDTSVIKGTAAVITTYENPYAAMSYAFKLANELGYIVTPPKDEKKYPEALEYLGWCTWNAFYHDVTEKGIIAKLEEFKAKNIPVKWLLIDDGWAQTDGFKLKSIYEDKSKFPKGLKATIDLIKKEYGIKWVGIWHSATGYWQGTEFENKTIQNTNSDTLLPKGYEFFSEWHSYLKQQGIDFVKVDCQGNIFEYLKNSKDALKKMFEIQEGLEQSAGENFDFMINCMGMNNVNVLNRRSSALMRSSDDFYPDKDDSLKSHIMQNVYNSVFNDNLYYCDFDMWWSEHFQAKQNAALRSISGGPFYLSDELGKSDTGIIKLFADDNGKINRCDNALKPARDCLFGFDKVLKVFNTCGNTGIVALFTFEEAAGTSISAADFGGSGIYSVKELFSNEIYQLCENEEINVDLSKNDVRLFVFEK